MRNDQPQVASGKVGWLKKVIDQAGDVLSRHFEKRAALHAKFKIVFIIELTVLGPNASSPTANFGQMRTFAVGRKTRRKNPSRRSVGRTSDHHGGGSVSHERAGFFMIP